VPVWRTSNAVLFVLLLAGGSRGQKVVSIRNVHPEEEKTDDGEGNVKLRILECCGDGVTPDMNTEAQDSQEFDDK